MTASLGPRLSPPRPHGRWDAGGGAAWIGALAAARARGVDPGETWKGGALLRHSLTDSSASLLLPPPQAPKVQKSKAQKLLAAQSSAKGKGKKKKWAKTKIREKKNNLVVFNQALLDKLLKEVPQKMRIVTVYNLVEQYKINGSLARRSIRELLNRGSIKPISLHNQMSVYAGIGALQKAQEKAAAAAAPVAAEAEE